MNYHREALEEHDESVKKALSNIDQETLAKTKEILNSKEFKKTRRKRINSCKISNFKKFCRKHCFTLISLSIGALALLIAILDYIFK